MSPRSLDRRNAGNIDQANSPTISAASQSRNFFTRTLISSVGGERRDSRLSAPGRRTDGYQRTGRLGLVHRFAVSGRPLQRHAGLDC
jgi:hypothetical protein